MDSKGLKVPVPESDKLQVSVLGCRFSEKAEHLPIKKRRFLFRASSPPLDTTSSDGTERVAACLDSSGQEVQPKPDASCLPAASLTVADLGQGGSSDSKVDGKELVKAKASKDEDICGISLVDVPTCSNSLGGDADLCKGSSGAKNLEALCIVKSEENSVKLVNMSSEETDFHIYTAPFKDVASSIMDHSSPNKPTLDNSTPDESTLDNSCSRVPSESECSRMNQVTSETQKSAARDDRLLWDLNTVMDAWEEPLECSNITYAEEGKDTCKEGNSEGCELGWECGSASENIIGNKVLPVDLKSLADMIEESKLEERKPSCADIRKLFSSVTDSVPRVAVNQIDSSNDAIPANVHSALTLCDISAKHVNVNWKGTDDLSCPMAADIGFSLDYSIPPGFNHCIKMDTVEENVDVSSTIVASGNTVNHAITTVETVIENKKHDLSLVTVASLQNGVHQSGITFNEDDKSKVKKEISSNGITMESLDIKGTDLSQETDKGGCKAANPTTFGSLLVAQSSVAAEVEDQPAVVSSIKTEQSEQSPLTATSEKPMMLPTGTIYPIAHESHAVCSDDLVSSNKEACEVPLDNCLGSENFQSDIQAGSEVDNVDELSVGYDSQYEDGELRESIIQTWEGYEGEDRENEHATDNRGTSFDLGTLGAHENSSECVPEVSSRARSTDVGSQKGADEISSVLLSEKLESSDQVSGSEPNEASNDTQQVMTTDTTQSNQWKMNVSGWDLLPEDHNTSNNVTKIRDLSSIKFSRIQRHGSENEDVETKAECSRFYRREPISRIGGPSARDSFLNRGRLRTQGCSSMDANGSTSRPVRDPNALRSLRRGRGGGTWNRSPGRNGDLNHLHSPPYQAPPFRRSMLEDGLSVDNLTNELDPNDNSRPIASSYTNRQSFRTRLPTNREEDEFRARLGLRPSGDTFHDRSVNVGRGRPLRYNSRQNEGGPRGRYYSPASDDYNEPLIEYPHPFPSRRRCFSPIERRENHNHPLAHHRSGSISPSRSRTRSRSPINDGFRRRTSRSPNFRSDARMRRPRSPNYQIGFESDHVREYNLEPRNNNSPPSSRFVNYKQRSSVLDRRIDPPVADRFNIYDSSRKQKQDENYSRSGHPGRFNELHGAGRGEPRYFGNDGDQPDHGFRGGGLVRRYDMGRPVKHFRYDEEDDYGPVYDSREKDGLEFHGRGNPKPYSNGTTDTRFRDLPRRPREERENW